MRPRHVAAILCIIPPALLAFAGCMALAPVGMPQATPPQRMAPAEWAGVRAVRVSFNVHSSVSTQRRDWEGTLLSFLTRMAGAVAGAAVQSRDSVGPALFQEAATSGLNGKVETKDDSLRVSYEVQKNLAGWRVGDVAAEKIRSSLQARTALPVEVQALGDLTKADGAKLLAHALRWEAIPGPHGDIHATFQVALKGVDRLALHMELMWFPTKESEELAAAALEKRNQGAFQIHELGKATDGRALEESMKQFRTHSFASRAYGRQEWFRDGCALLKQEAARGLDELCGRMAACMFPGAPAAAPWR